MHALSGIKVKDIYVIVTITAAQTFHLLRNEKDTSVAGALWCVRITAAAVAVRRRRGLNYEIVIMCIACLKIINK
jgi:hypothetical protein